MTASLQNILLFFFAKTKWQLITKCKPISTYKVNDFILHKANYLEKGLFFFKNYSPKIRGEEYFYFSSISNYVPSVKVLVFVPNIQLNLMQASRSPVMWNDLSTKRMPSCIHQGKGYSAVRKRMLGCSSLTQWEFILLTSMEQLLHSQAFSVGEQTSATWCFTCPNSYLENCHGGYENTWPPMNT